MKICNLHPWLNHVHHSASRWRKQTLLSLKKIVSKDLYAWHLTTTIVHFSNSTSIKKHVNLIPWLDPNVTQRAHVEQILEIP